MKRIVLLCISVVGVACADLTGPSLECHLEITGHPLGVLHFADGRADTLRARVEVWADTVEKCATR